MQKEFNLTYLFIAHGLATVKHVSDRIGVMYLGNLIEISTKQQLYKNPLHPYTEALLSAIPIPDPTVERSRIILEGDVPSPVNVPSGCPFRSRCKYAVEVCSKNKPQMKEVEPGHYTACLRYEKNDN